MNSITIVERRILTESDSITPKSFEKFTYEVPEVTERQTTFPEHQLIEKDAFSFLNAGRTFFDSYDFANGNSQTYSLSLPGIAPSTSVRLSVQFGAAGKKSSSVAISFNDSACGTLSFAALSEYEYGKVSSRTITLPAPKQESNNVKLVHTRESGIAGHLDYIRASYIRRLNLTGNELLFRPNATGSVVFSLTGGNASTIFWRISNTKGIEEVEGTFDSSTNTWSIPFTSDTSASANDWKSEELVALNPSATFPTPTLVGNVENQNLHALRNIDFVIVVPNSGKITQQAQRLADIHTQVDTMKCAVVTSSDQSKMASVRCQIPQLDCLFDKVFTAEDFTVSKPAPDCYLLGAHTFNADIDECVVFEDAYTGLQAGVSSGIFTIGLASNHTQEELQDKCDYVLDSFEGMTYDKLVAIMEK